MKERKKVALVLSGGAALGFAHIGVIKVLEEYNIPIDTVCVQPNTIVEQLVLDNITTENHTDSEMPFFTKCGEVKNLHANALYADNKAVEIK